MSMRGVGSIEMKYRRKNPYIGPVILPDEQDSKFTMMVLNA